MSVSTFRTQTSSEFAIEHDEERIGEALSTLQVDEAEQAFVRNDYNLALHLSNEVLEKAASKLHHHHHQQQQKRVRDGKKNIDSSNSVWIPLSWQYGERVCYFSRVSLSNDLRDTDRAAAVVLQCQYELQMQGRQQCDDSDDDDIDNHTTQTLEQNSSFWAYYTLSPMPLELALVLIQYELERHTTAAGGTVEARGEGQSQVTTQAVVENGVVLLQTCFASRLGFHPGTLTTVVEDLWWTIVCKALPLATHTSYVQHTLQRILPKKTPTTKTDKEEEEAEACRALARQNQWMVEPTTTGATNALLNQLDSFEPFISQECLHRCRTHLQQVLLNIKSTQAQRHHKPTKLPLMVRQPHHKADWYRYWAKRFLVFVQLRVIHPLFVDPNRWANRGHTALTILLTYLAWKKRRRILQTTSGAVSILTSPLQEILDAFLPMPQW